jgi:hypothetical protein
MPTVATAQVGGDIHAAIGGEVAELKELRRQIKAAEAEMEVLVAKGLKVSAQQSANLGAMKAKEATIKRMVDDKTSQKKFDKQMVAATRMLRGIMTAQTIANMVKGDVSATDVGGLAMLAVHQRKYVAKIVGKEMAGVLRSLGPAAMLVGLTVDMFKEGFKGYRELQEGMSEVGQRMRVGKITKAEELYAQHILTDTFDDPKASLAALDKVGDKISALPPEQLAKALSWKELESRGRGVRGEFLGQRYDVDNATQTRVSVTKTLPINEFLQSLSQNRAIAEGRIGGALNQAQWNEVVHQTLADICRERNIKQDILDKIMANLVDQEKMVLEESHVRKFRDMVDKEREHAEARRNFIPAKLEY